MGLILRVFLLCQLLRNIHPCIPNIVFCGGHVWHGFFNVLALHLPCASKYDCSYQGKVLLSQWGLADSCVYWIVLCF